LNIRGWFSFITGQKKVDQGYTSVDQCKFHLQLYKLIEAIMATKNRAKKVNHTSVDKCEFFPWLIEAIMAMRNRVKKVGRTSVDKCKFRLWLIEAIVANDNDCMTAWGVPKGVG